MASPTARVRSSGGASFLGWVRTTRPTTSWSRKATSLPSVTSSPSAKRLRRYYSLYSFCRGPYALCVFAGRESFFMAMYFSVVAWSSTWFRALISVCEGPSGRITWAAAAAAAAAAAGGAGWCWAGCWGPRAPRRATMTVDEASLSLATRRGVVAPVPWPWRRRRRGPGPGRGRGRGGSPMGSW
jgi:hypothetical protein